MKKLSILILAFLVVSGVASAGLLGHWTFDETVISDGDTVSAAVGSAGTFGSGGDTDNHSVAGKFGNALQLDGNDYVDLSLNVPTLGSLGTGSISLWFNTTGGFQTMFSASTSTDASSEMRIFMVSVGGTLGFESRNDETTLYRKYSSTGAYNNGQWHHLAVTTGLTGTNLYVNGVLQSHIADIDDAGFFADVLDLDKISIGRNVDDKPAGEWYYTGLMDEVLIYDHILTEKEIRTLTNGGRPASVDVTETGNNTIVFEHNQTADTFDVVLTSDPTADVEVTVGFDSSTVGQRMDMGNGAGNPLTLTFDGTNWSVPQTVTVQAVDDTVANGHATSALNFDITSTDPDFDGGWVYPDIDVSIVDNETPDLILNSHTSTSSIGEVNKHDRVINSASYDIVLSSQPSAEVTVGIADIADPNKVEVNPASVTFTSSNWDTPVQVTAMATEDSDLTGFSDATSLKHSAISFDLDYDGQIKNVDVVVLNDECGSWGYHPVDLNKDCEVNFLDLSMLASYWLNCTTPYQTGCDFGE
jgi:hypothetical protein